jgi:ABC-type Mn2+/Zn2+ transport system permease subunit
MKEVPYTPPIEATKHSKFAIILTCIGMLATALFFVYQMRAEKSKRKLSVELSIGFIAAFFLGFGTLFIMLSFGLYV